MIETYAFLAAFPLQVLTMSVLLPAWFARQIRRQAVRIPAERLAQVYPGIDPGAKLDRYLKSFRLITSGIAVVGALLLAWMFSRVGSSDALHDAANWVSFYFMLQALPIVACAVLVERRKSDILTRSLPEARRKATLRHRNLFDFVSPLAVLLSATAYVAFVAFVFYLREHPFPGFAGLVNIACVSVLYAANAFGIHRLIYGKKINALETQDSLRSIGPGVRCLVYSNTLAVGFLSLHFTLKMFALYDWEAFATSLFFVIAASLSAGAFGAIGRQVEIAH